MCCQPVWHWWWDRDLPWKALDTMKTSLINSYQKQGSAITDPWAAEESHLQQVQSVLPFPRTRPFTGVCLGLCPSTEQVPSSTSFLLPCKGLWTTCCLNHLASQQLPQLPVPAKMHSPGEDKNGVLLPSQSSGLQSPPPITPKIWWPDTDLIMEQHLCRKEGRGSAPDMHISLICLSASLQTVNSFSLIFLPSHSSSFVSESHEISLCVLQASASLAWLALPSLLRPVSLPSHDPCLWGSH